MAAGRTFIAAWHLEVDRLQVLLFACSHHQGLQSRTTCLHTVAPSSIMACMATQAQPCKLMLYQILCTSCRWLQDRLPVQLGIEVARLQIGRPACKFTVLDITSLAYSSTKLHLSASCIRPQNSAVSHPELLPCGQKRSRPVWQYIQSKPRPYYSETVKEEHIPSCMLTQPHP